MNIVFCGPSGSGKSTAIRRLLRGLQEPIYGFWTEKLPADPDGRCPVYIHGCREPLSYDSDHLIGYASPSGASAYPQTFEALGRNFLQEIPKGSLVLMDEIGIMEQEAHCFCAGIFEILDGDYRVIAAVRQRDTALLQAVRSHPKSLCLSPGEKNTAALLAHLEQK